MDELKKLVEKRQVQATLRRITLKMTTVLHELGEKMYLHGGTCGTGIEQTFLEDYENLEEEMPTYEGGFSEIGYYYDTLHLGKNFELRFLTYDGELKASYNGFVVYKEVNGELTSYVPNPEWEDWLERLYDRASERELVRKKDEKVKQESRFTREVNRVIRKLMETWGTDDK